MHEGYKNTYLSHTQHAGATAPGEIDAVPDAADLYEGHSVDYIVDIIGFDSLAS